jgi:hypothetical protein
MPVTVVVSPEEAEALRDANVRGVDGVMFTYNLEDAPAHLAKIEHLDTIWQRLAARLTAIATQLGVSNTFFRAVDLIDDKPEETGGSASEDGSPNPSETQADASAVPAITEGALSALTSLPSGEPSLSHSDATPQSDQADVA